MKSKEEIEEILYDILYHALSRYNQESGLISIEYDPETKNAIATLNVVEVPEDDYVGFSGY